ncbi:MAG: hypothetical protein HY828_17885 [Actinobacteria bacterium]|nr:hypothetical protein [Actinomycetota bacterium]
MTGTTTHTVYTGRSTNWPMIWLSTALLIPLVAMAKGSGDSWTNAGMFIPLLVVFIVAAINLLTATSVRTVTGPNGVTVYFGVFGWPRFRYPINRIQHAEAVELRSSVWTWGLYWSPKRGLMLTLRTGPALHLVLTNGRQVTISTPDPAAAKLAIGMAKTDRPSSGER